ncbi:hypothetical protein [Hydrocarboniphaga sp.]|uniref:hypothetical protein n=1 Tax=Hydrocarboniphaga sp. TaxID=2033016 RepID=UPI002609C754|nr:hypothetical protein [Hydrocarboniphaga sp.]
MKNVEPKRRVLTAVVLLCCAQSLAAEDGPPPPAAEIKLPAVAGWNEFVDGLRGLPERMLAKLPESMRNDPQVQQEVGRLMLESLASSTLDAIGGDGDFPSFLPVIGQLMNIGQPNADTVYRSARITPGGSYRMRGQRGSLRMLVIAETGPSPGEPGFDPAHARAPRSTHDLNALELDAQGRFDVLLSPQRPDAYAGDWWPLSPTTDKLLLRMVSSDWSRERDPTIAIERVDKPMDKPRRSAAELEQRLRRLPNAAAFMALLFADHVEQLRKEGYVNKLKVFDTSQIGGLANQFYYEGAYDLRDDEALIVEATVPAHCLYRSIILTNEIYETIDWYNNHSSLNDTQAAADADGVLRVVVSAKDPGVPNWLDTAGYPRGVIQGRWTECDSKPVPSVRKLAFSKLRKALPRDTATVTAEQRERVIRERRIQLQQWPLW